MYLMSFCLLVWTQEPPSLSSEGLVGLILAIHTAAQSEKTQLKLVVLFCMQTGQMATTCPSLVLCL